jgi:hypothetical protein
MATDRERAVEAARVGKGGQPRLLCAQCGARVVRRGTSLFCPQEVTHVGLALPASAQEARLLVAMRVRPSDWRMDQLDGLPVALRNRLAYLIIRDHNWGDHRLCDWLPRLGTDRPECAPVNRPVVSLWKGRRP